MEYANGMITLTTDFGHADGFVGAMKGVILSRFGGATMIDIAHDIPRQDVLAGALVLQRACPLFPPGTVHLAVVDPGVGSARAGIIAETSNYLFVLPDNGLLTLIAQNHTLLRVHRLEDASYRLPMVSSSFHGRDIFAPAAAHAAAGVSPKSFGPKYDQPVMLTWPQWRKNENGIHGEIVGVDVFGNLMTNIPNRVLEEGHWRLTLGEWVLVGPAKFYAEATLGKPLFLMGSNGWVEVAVNGQHAADNLGVAPGQAVVLEKVV